MSSQSSIHELMLIHRGSVNSESVVLFVSQGIIQEIIHYRFLLEGIPVTSLAVPCSIFSVKREVQQYEVPKEIVPEVLSISRYENPNNKFILHPYYSSERLR